MISHKFFIVGIAGTLISLLYLGILYLSGKILNSIVSLNAADWNVSDNYFISPIAFGIGIFCLIISLILCMIDLFMARRDKQ